MSPKGGRREGSGRPKLGKSNLKRITIRISPEMHERLKKIQGYNARIREFLEKL